MVKYSRAVMRILMIAHIHILLHVIV